MKRLPLVAGMTGESQMRTRSRRGFSLAAIVVVIIVGAWTWAVSQSGKDGVPSFLRWTTESSDEEHDREGKGEVERDRKPSDSQAPAGQERDIK